MCGPDLAPTAAVNHRHPLVLGGSTRGARSGGDVLVGPAGGGEQRHQFVDPSIEGRIKVPGYVPWGRQLIKKGFHRLLLGFSELPGDLAGRRELRGRRIDGRPLGEVLQGGLGVECCDGLVDLFKPSE